MKRSLNIVFMILTTIGIILDLMSKSGIVTLYSMQKLSMRV